MKKLTACLVLALTALVAAPALAQHDSGGGGVGCGDVFGDLIEVLRDATTGQPILQKRWVELPKETPGYGWGYCKIAIDALGNELAFAPLSCDVAEADLPKVLPVDYFGRLNGGRTKEKNSRMHLNEVLSTIKEAEMVHQESAGRLRFGYDCKTDKDGYPQSCAEWSIVDSPMESLGLYTRLMKYGHIQTDPLEKDAWAHGDPATLPIQYNPALTPNDWKKFHHSVWHLLPGFTGDRPNPSSCFLDVDANGIWEPLEPHIDVVPEEEETGNGVYDPGEPFADLNGNGVRDAGLDTFASACAAAQYLDHRDFSRGASFLGGAANKTGKVTTDLVQYLNRILKITLKTATTVSTTKTLGALVRVCTSEPENPDPNAEPPVEPTYDMEACTIDEAEPTVVDPFKVFPDLHERFVDFLSADYTRGDTMDEAIVTIIRPEGGESWVQDEASLMDWLAYRNGVPTGAIENIDGFVAAGNDAVRTIEFIHNYAIPEDLGWDFGGSVPPTAAVKTK